MNRTIKDANVKTCCHGDLETLGAHVLAFFTATDFAKHCCYLAAQRLR